MSWTAIWDRSGALRRPNTPAPVADASTFVFQSELPASPKPGEIIWGHREGVAVSHDGGGVFSLRHRAQRTVLTPDVIRPGDTVRLTYRSGGRSAGLELLNLDQRSSALHTLADFGPISAQEVSPDEGQTADLVALADCATPFGQAAGLQAGTPVATPSGYCAVEDLHRGAIVLTGEGKRAQVVGLQAQETISCGDQAAIRLRAPFFGLSQDVWVSPHQEFRLSGAEVDYTFGVPDVTVAAGDLVDNLTIVRDLSAPTRVFYNVALDQAESLSIGRCSVAANASGLQTSPRIDRVAAFSLRTLCADHRDLLSR